MRFRTAPPVTLAIFMLKPAKSTPHCLSHWRLSSLAIEAPGSQTEAEQAHLDTCKICNRTWQQELALLSHRRQQGLPAYLQAQLAFDSRSREPARRLPWWSTLAFGSVAAAAALVLIVISPFGETVTERVKGSKVGSEIHLSALRGEALIAHDVRLGESPPLMEGDRLRLRLVTSKRWFGLWTQDDGVWTSLAQGSVPQDGWLSLGFRYSGKHRSNMAVLLCPQAPSAKDKALQATTHPKGCERVPFAL